MTIDLEALALVRSIARRGSFAAAARALGKVPSAVTYTVRQLEQELDVLLFDRRGNRAALTDAGQALLEDGERLLLAADALTARVRGIAGGWESELRIGVDAVIAFERLAPLIRDFDRLGAPTRLRVSHEVLDGSWDGLLAGRIDLALGVPGLQAPASFGARPGAPRQVRAQALGSVRFVFCVAPAHPLARTLPDAVLDEADLRVHRAVVLADSSREPGSTSMGLLDGQQTITVATLEQKIAAQAAGLGTGYLPEAFARPWLEQGRLVSRRLAHPRAPLQLAYAWHKADGRALHWWLDRLSVARVRRKLLEGPLR